MGLVWPGEDWSILGLVAGCLVVSLLAVRFCRDRGSRAAVP
jgi:hypothetical protein